MRLVHVMAGLGEASGVANIARRFARRQAESGDSVILCAPMRNDSCKPVGFAGGQQITWPLSRTFGFVYFSWGMLFHLPRLVKTADEVWVHCSWTFPVWYGAWLTSLYGKRLVVVPEASFDPKRIGNHARWKKRLVMPLDKWVLRQADVVLALCSDEIDWVCGFEPRSRVRFERVPTFYDCAELNKVGEVKQERRPLRVLFLGRVEDPLKGVRYLEQAVKELNAIGSPSATAFRAIELRIESAVFGEAKEAAWNWCDVLCLPTLSENFGLVVAEALEHGKRVITTDGAPAWEPTDSMAVSEDWLIYLRGYREGTEEMRVRQLEDAIRRFL